jgi:hypothetical protein
VLACGAFAAAGLARSPTGVLRWDGGDWSWEEGGRTAAGQPEIALDLQSRCCCGGARKRARALAVAGARVGRVPLGRAAPCGIFPRQHARARCRQASGGRTMTKTPPAAPPASSGDTDLMLVERTVAGDQKAFELLVMKYQRRIERLIGRMVRDTNLIETFAQETFIRAYRALPQFRGEAQFYTWLYRIAVNTAKKALVDLKRDPWCPKAPCAAVMTTTKKLPAWRTN